LSTACGFPESELCKITWSYVEINLVYEEELSVSWYPVSINCQTTILKVHKIEVCRYIAQLSFVKFILFISENGDGNWKHGVSVKNQGESSDNFYKK